MSTDSKTAFDMVVVGAGSGGLAAAKRAAGYGAKVAICEDDRVGGTCVIRGCVPKKLMVYASMLGAARALACDFGFAEGPQEFNWQRLCQVRDQVVNNLELAHRRHLAQANVEVINQRAHVASPATVVVGEQTLQAKKILVAAGATATRPTFPGHEHCLSSDDFFKLAQKPKRALLIGGGYIAVEFACLLQGLGCQTTLLARSQVLRRFDEDLRLGMVDAMRHRKLDVHEGARMHEVTQTPDGAYAVVWHDGQNTKHTATVDKVLFTAGRTPNTLGLGLEEAGVRLGSEGQVLVDAHHQSSVPSIYAVGDVIDRVNLTPCAIKAGRLLADHLFKPGGSEATMDYENIATAVFGQPPIGTVGKTEAQAQESFGRDAVRVYKARYIPLLYAGSPVERKTSSIMKVVVHAPTDKVVGIHMLGDDAPEIIQGFAVALLAGITKAQLDATVAVHPTQAEELVLMR